MFTVNQKLVSCFDSVNIMVNNFSDAFQRHHRKVVFFEHLECLKIKVFDKWQQYWYEVVRLL